MNKLNVQAVMKVYAKHKNKILAIVAGVLVPSMIFASVGSLSGEKATTIINCEVAGACNIVVAAPEAVSMVDEGSFGAVKSRPDEFTVFSALQSDELITNGTSTNNGYSSTTAVVREAYGAFASSASSQTLCAIRNTGSIDRLLTHVALGVTTSSYTGTTAQDFTISLSPTQGATGSGVSLLFDNFVTLPTSTALSFTTTSTLQGTGGAQAVWRKGVWLNWLIASPTSTLTGDCRASYY